VAIKLIPPNNRSPNWTARGSEFGRRVEFSTGTRDRRQAEETVKAYLETLIRERIGAKTFAYAIDAYCAYKHPGKTERKWFARMKAMFGDKRLEEVIHADLVQVIERYMPEASNAYKNRAVITPASAVLHYAAKQRWCPYVKMERYKVPKESQRQPARREDVGALLGATSGPKHLLFAILFETGLRISDALALTAPAGTSDLGYVRLQKTRSQLLAPISSDLQYLIAASARYHGDHLFPWRSRWSVYKWLRPLCRELGVEYTPHRSRHALATDLQLAGRSDAEAAKYGGWSDPQSLRRYQHAAPRPVSGRAFLTVVPKKPKTDTA
jgi:integrase